MYDDDGKLVCVDDFGERDREVRRGQESELIGAVPRLDLMT
jgi:hypothetical protein